MSIVQFNYLSGILVDDVLISSAQLQGSWDRLGSFTESFSTVEMHPYISEDGCQSFTANVQFAESEEGKTFRWTVLLEIDGQQRLGITEEVNSGDSKENIRSFQLLSASGENQTEIYRLNWSRHLGAQKLMIPGEQEPRIQFAVWAPNAQQVEVIMVDLWMDGQEVSAIDPNAIPALRTMPAEQVCGGYVSDTGEGVVNNWQPLAMIRDNEGVWRTEANDPAAQSFRRFEHCSYLYRVTRDDGSVAYRSDLYSRCQIGFGTVKPVGRYTGRTQDLDGTVSGSVVKDPDKICQFFDEEVYPEQHWQSASEFWLSADATPLPPRPNRLEDLVIYEIHIGALGFGKANDKPGTLQDAINLLDYLQDLGVNAIELLPLAEFGGGGGAWGYSTSHYFAIEYAGGGRDKYKHFIRECHRRGMAVILDVVFNHYNHDAQRAEWMYDTTAHDRNIYYWYEGHPDDYGYFNSVVPADQQGQGGYVDNMSTGWAPRYWDPFVRRMFISSLIAHIEEFHIDGFRFDQTTSIHAYNVLHADGREVGSANTFGQKLLREATRSLRLLKPDVLLMAEDHSHWSAVTEPVENGGLGFGATWYSDFYHHLIGDTNTGNQYAKLLKTAGNGFDGPLAMDVFAAALASSGHSNVVYHESHDEAGNGELTDRTINVAVNGAPLIGETRRVAEARVRTVAGITLLSAGTPMFLFGEEVGAMKKFMYGEVLNNREDLEGMRNSYGANLFAYYQALIRLRLNPSYTALRSRNIDIVYVSNDNRLIAFRRWQYDQHFLVIASLSNHSFDRPSYTIISSQLGDESWREVFNSDSSTFDGNNVGNAGGILPSGQGWLQSVIPANGLVVLERL
jgi:1,4-alpha-glucan branching enzyme